ncbi:MAG: prepilin-type N-terminal cleavage/methylation domain-containing protein, partial [Eubacteriales bacterium]|nr:prepilin-type N-terminal cleavage/methylation domain-containing protein [Eubacterium sp.]MDY5494243.1 prepilin-type N-terminal cleavage/methylation domain-containing protein [Eubacteriales bacterium]
MRNKKGFTLVELVIVIAVIAILAGVMIGTFASVVKKAKESAKMQEMTAQKQEQIANDIDAKLKNAEWLGWSDFEEKLATAVGDAITK